jgi:probable HAF family extracellular repeat protein
MKRIATFLIVCCLWLLVAASTCFAQMYTVTDLGTLGGSWSYANGINASRQVVGRANTSSNGDHAFRTAPNSPINPATDDLWSDSPPGFAFEYNWANDINDSGQVVGQAHYNHDDYAFRTAPNNPITLGDFLDAFSTSTAINASGQVVTDSFLYHFKSFRWGANGTIKEDIGSLSPVGPTDTWGYGINDSGQVVGWSTIAAYGPSHAFRTAPNSPINPATDDLGTLGGSGSSATGINAFGQVVGGASLTGDTAGHAFRTAPNAAINPATDDLGTLGGSFSSATSINNYGQVVGWSSLPGDTVQHAFLYDGGVMRDLNNLIAGGSSCAVSGLQNSPDINDAGQIAANVSCNGQVHAARLDPIYKAFVQHPINTDGSSVFSAKRGVVPVKFTLTQDNAQTCTLPPATIRVTGAVGGTLAVVDESIYSTQADSGSNFRIDPTACQYVYNLAASSLGVGTYVVDISIDGIMVGHAFFALK